MADRKAVNKYYPPDWDPSKGSINRHNKSHPLRARARKVDEGILVVRFELPFNLWCLKCDNHVGMGVRYNAEKSRNGSYYTTPIYKFRMKCHLCDNHFEIQTDPSKFDYTILSGARRQVMSAESSDDTGQLLIDTDESKRRMTDAMFRLEKKVEDQLNGEALVPSLKEIHKWKSRWDDSFSANQLLRRQYREKRKSIEVAKKRDRNLLKRTSLKVPLVKANAIDSSMAKEIFDARASRVDLNEELKKKRIINSSIVSKTSDKMRPASPQTSHTPNANNTGHPHRRVVKINPDPG